MEDKTLKLLLLIPLYLFVIIGLFVAFNQYQLQKKIGNDPCWACGKYKSKSCTFILPSQEIRNSPKELNNFLDDLAEQNSKVETKIDYSYLQTNKKLNISLDK